MKFWRIDDSEYVIAPTADEAWRLALAADVLGSEPNFDDAEIDELPPDRVFEFHDDGGLTRSKTCGEWCADLGPGYFCSADW